MHIEMDEPARPFVIGAWLVAAFLLWFVLHVNLLPALLADCSSSSWSTC
jgi:hypothetical protein